MTRNVIRGIALLAALCLTLSAFATLPGPFNNDPGDGSGGSGSCTYCSQSACGCSPPPSGYYLQFSCSCSSTQCTRSCQYVRM